uniref:Reverse transcriptase domain-containing protein n=1 Tax=Amphimedon queenslandica TaxID=400682 RepID=A0A1X7UWG5_AMPQE
MRKTGETKDSRAVEGVKNIDQRDLTTTVPRDQVNPRSNHKRWGHLSHIPKFVQNVERIIPLGRTLALLGCRRQDGVLQRSTTTLVGLSRYFLNVKECFEATMEKGKMKAQETIYVVEGLQSPSVKAELARLESEGVISRVTEPSDWCAGMVVVPKANHKVRICVDLTIDHVLAQIRYAKHFSKLNANSGFWHIELSPESSMITFITLFGRFKFNQLPFGISSAPEYFQRKISEILSGIEGHVVNEIGVSPDLQKTKAIVNTPRPTNIVETERFIRMLNQLSKFSTHLSEKTKPI